MSNSDIALEDRLVEAATGAGFGSVDVPNVDAGFSGSTSCDEA